MNSVNNHVSDMSQAAENGRQQYHSPKLINLGPIQSVVMTGTSTAGDNGGQTPGHS